MMNHFGPAADDYEKPQSFIEKPIAFPSADQNLGNSSSRVLSPENVIHRRLFTSVSFYPAEVSSGEVEWVLEDPKVLQIRTSMEKGSKRYGDLGRVVLKEMTLKSYKNTSTFSAMISTGVSPGFVYGNEGDKDGSYVRGAHVLYGEDTRSFEQSDKCVHLFKPSAFNDQTLEKYGKLSQAAIDGLITWMPATNEHERICILRRGHPVRNAWELNTDRFIKGVGWSYDHVSDLLSLHESLYKGLHSRVVEKLKELDFQDLRDFRVRFTRADGKAWNDTDNLTSKKRPGTTYDDDEAFVSEVFNSQVTIEAVIELKYIIINLDE